MKVSDSILSAISTMILSIVVLGTSLKLQKTIERVDKIQGIADTSLSNSIQALKIITNIQRKVDSAITAKKRQ